MRKTVSDKVNDIISTLEATILGLHREAIDSVVIPTNLNVIDTTTDASEIVTTDLEINTSGSSINMNDDFDGAIADSNKQIEEDECTDEHGGYLEPMINPGDDDDDNYDDCGMEDKEEAGIDSTCQRYSSSSSEHFCAINPESPEAESWKQCLQNAILLLDDFKEAADYDIPESKYPRRLSGLAIFWYSNEDSEWDIVKVDCSLTAPDSYRLQSLSTGEWFYDVRLAKDGYGRENRSFILVFNSTGACILA